MYQRIMNSLDVDIWARNVKGNLEDIVITHIKDEVGVLDDAYGGRRGIKDMGGYVLFFDNEKVYEECVDEIMDYYMIDKELFEFSDCINANSKSEIKWMEELYLLSSDDAILLIHPKTNTEI